MTTVPSATSTSRQVGRLRSIHSEHLRSARSWFFQIVQYKNLRLASVGCLVSFRIILHALEGWSDFHAILYSPFVISSRLCLSFSVYSTYFTVLLLLFIFSFYSARFLWFSNPRYIREFETQEQCCGTGTGTVGTVTFWLVEPEPEP